MYRGLSMYEDHKLKIKVYRDMIKKSLIKQGQFPSKEMVEGLLEHIDMKYAILDHITIAENSSFDVAQINTELYCLYKDLVILYSVVYELENKKYIELESFINGYLTSLEEIADECEQKTNLQTEATTLGKTILFESNGSNISFNNSKAVIDLKSLSVEAKSEISCFIEGSGFTQDKVVFNFYQNDKVIYTTSPYSIDNNTVVVDGDIDTKTYEYSVDQNEQRSNMFKIPTIEANDEYYYYGYGGKNQLMIVDQEGRHIYKKSNTAIFLTNKSEVHFYVHGASYFNMDISQEPIVKNFTNYNMHDLPEIAEINFTAQRGTSFSFETDGTIFAEEETMQAEGKELYVTQTTHVEDILVFEIRPGKPVFFDRVEAIIYNIDHEFLHIDSIAIKQRTNIKKAVIQ